MAATDASARELAHKVQAILAWFEAVRAADRDTPPIPVPDWWDGYVRDPEWLMQIRGLRQTAARETRLIWASFKARGAIDVVLGKWSALTEPIRVRASERPLFKACEEGLRHLGGVLQRDLVVPDERHLAEPLPGVWELEGETDAEGDARENVYDLLFSMPRKKRVGKAAEKREFHAATARLAKLTEARTERNRERAAKARHEGCVTAAELEERKVGRHQLQEKLRAWRLREADVRRLLAWLNGTPGDRAMNEDLARLLGTFERFRGVLDAGTVSAKGGRRVIGPANAKAVSDASDALNREIHAVQQILSATFGRPIGAASSGITIGGSDSRSGPGTPLDVHVTSMSIGDGGAPAELMGTLESLSGVLAFPLDRWNALQARNPGGNHLRWDAGEVIGAESLELLDAAGKLLRIHTAGEVAASRTQTAEWLSARDFSIKWAITPDRLRKAREDKRLTRVRKRGGQWQYDLVEVKELWPGDFADV
jgi:hypothetical protein